MKRRAFAFLCMTSLIAAACGDDGGKVHPIADSNKMADARVCVGATPATTGAGALDFLNYISDSSGGVIRWVGDTNEMIDGLPAFYQVAFYSGIESSLTGTFDLTAGNQSNYDTCAICIRAFTYDPAQQNKIIKRFYQSGGSVTLNKDPFGVGKNLDMTITNLQLEESTFDMNAHSDPVAGGTCLNYGGTAMMHDSVPNGFMGGASCAKQNFNSGGTCSCNCGGVLDPDCGDATTTLNLDGCSGTAGANMCSSAGTCIQRPINDTCANATALVVSTTASPIAPKDGTTEGAKHDYSGGLATCLNYLDANNQPIADPMPGPDTAYVVSLTGGTAYTFHLTNLDPDVDLSLSLVGPGASTDCSAAITKCVKGADEGFAGDDETFSYTPGGTGAQTFYLIVDAYNDYNANNYGNITASGAYKIQVTQP